MACGVDPLPRKHSIRGIDADLPAEISDQDSCSKESVNASHFFDLAENSFRIREDVQRAAEHRRLMKSEDRFALRNTSQEAMYVQKTTNMPCLVLLIGKQREL